MTHGILLSLSIPAEWGRIDRVRQAVALSVWAVFGDDGLRDALGMVSAELLENAVKYGKSGAAKVEISLREEPSRLVIVVSNEIDPGSSHSHSLRDRIAWLRGFSHPSEAYAAALSVAFSSSSLEGVESGLGIARIAYEGGCELDCDTTSSNRVVVRASRPIASSAARTSM